MATVAESATSLLAEAQVLSGKPKIEKLMELKELVINREPSLLATYVPLMCEYQADKEADVRKFVVQFIEEALQHEPQHLLQSGVPCALLSAATDKNSNVLKRVLLAGGFVVKLAVELIVKAHSSGPLTDAQKAMWDGVCQLKLRLLDSLDSTTDGVRTNALKYVESLVLLFSPSDKWDGVTFGLESIPDNHPLLQVPVLTAEGESYLETLLQWLEKPNISTTNLMVVVTSLGNAGKTRGHHLASIIPALVALQQNVPSHLKATQQKSIVTALMTGLVTIVKAGPSSVPYWEAIESCMTAADSKEQFDKARKEAEKIHGRDLKRAAAEDGGPSSKRQRVVEPSQEELIQHLGAILPNLPPSLCVDLIFANLANLSPTPPNDNVDSVANVDVVTFFQNLVKELNPQAALPPMPTGEVLPIVQDPRRRHVEPVKKEEDDSAAVSAALSSVTAAVKAPTLAPPVLSSETREIMRVDAFRRILNSESGAKSGGKLELRADVLARVAGTFALESPGLSEFVEHILENLKQRYNLAVCWIFQEFCNASTNWSTLAQDGALEPMERYRNVLHRIIGRFFELLPVFDKDKFLTKLLMDIPEITEGCLDAVKQFCEDTERVTLGLSTLWELILHRPVSRDRCLTILLEYTSHSEDFVRSRAIRLVSNRLFKDDRLADKIEEFATNKLKVLQDAASISALADEYGLGEEDMAVEGMQDECAKALEEVCRNNLLLYMTLWTKKHSLHTGLMDLYIGTTKEVKQLIHRETKALLPTLFKTEKGMASLISLISSYKPGAEYFVLLVLRTLTERESFIESPRADLVSATKALYFEKTNDVRFIIPVLAGLTKAEILNILPEFVKMPNNVCKDALRRIFRIKGTPVPPAEVIVALHGISTTKHGVTTRQISEAILTCIDDNKIVLPNVLASVLQQLVAQTPIPLLFMRTVIITLQRYPRLTQFVMDILATMIAKHVWEHEQLWEGFLICCQKMQPHSYNVVLRLPAPQFAQLVGKFPDMKAGLLRHTKSARNSIQPELLAVLDESANSQE